MIGACRASGYEWLHEAGAPGRARRGALAEFRTYVDGHVTRVEELADVAVSECLQIPRRVHEPFGLHNRSIQVVAQNSGAVAHCDDCITRQRLIELIRERHFVLHPDGCARTLAVESIQVARNDENGNDEQEGGSSASRSSTTRAAPSAPSRAARQRCQRRRSQSTRSAHDPSGCAELSV